MDFADKGLDDPSGVLNEDGTTNIVGGLDNLGWTGNVQIEFDYQTALELATDNVDINNVGDFAKAEYSLVMELFQQGEATKAVWSYIDDLGTISADELTLEQQITGNDSFSKSSSGSYLAFFDLRSMANGELPGDGYYWEFSLQQSNTSEASAVRPVPEPTSMLLLGAGLLGLGAFRKRRLS